MWIKSLAQGENILMLRFEPATFVSKIDILTTTPIVPRKVVEWAMRKKGIPEALVTAVMNMYRGARTKVKAGTHFYEEFEVNIGVHYRLVLSPLLFAIVVDVATNKIKEGMLQEILYADDSLCSGDHGGTAGNIS